VQYQNKESDHLHIPFAAACFIFLSNQLPLLSPFNQASICIC
jgi:hypothetical protein